MKNWVTSAAIVIGGIWVWYEWSTLFPKTESDVITSAAELRTRTLGSLAVSFIASPSGDGPVTDDGLDFAAVCQTTGQESTHVTLPVRAFLDLESSAPIPVRVEVTHFVVAELVSLSPALMGTGSLAFSANALNDVEEFELPKEAFVGELWWTTVEPQGRGALAVLGSVSLPFSCGSGGSSSTPAEFAIGLRAAVKADDDTSDSAELSFFQICHLRPDGSGNCSTAATDGSSIQDPTGGPATPQDKVASQ